MNNLYFMEEIYNELSALNVPDVDVLGPELYPTLSSLNLLEIYNKRDEETENILEKENVETLALNFPEVDVLGPELHTSLSSWDLLQSFLAEDNNKRDEEAENILQEKENVETMSLNENVLVHVDEDNVPTQPKMNLHLSYADVADAWSNGNIYLENQVSGGENGTVDTDEAKRAKRKQSNRESARRARRKKEAQLFELESKAAELKLKRDTLVRHLNDVKQKYMNVTVDKNVLTAKVNAEEAVMKMKEAEFITVTGLLPAYLASPEISTMIVSLFNGSLPYTSMDAAVPVPGGLNQLLYPAAAVPVPDGLNQPLYPAAAVPVPDGLNQPLYPAAADAPIFYID